VFAWTTAGIALVLSAGFLATPTKRPAISAPPSIQANIHANAFAAPAKVEAKVESPPNPSPNPRTIHAGTPVWSVALSPSGRWLAAGDEDRGIEIWETATGKRRTILRGHAAGVTALCFSHDERWLASGSADRTAKLWDIRGGAERNVFRQGSLVTAVALSADGHWLACASSDRRVKLWNLDVNDKPEGFREKGEPRALAFSPDGWLLAIGSENGLKLWGVDSRREVQSLDRPAAALAFAPNGHCLALHATAQTVKLWDTTTPRELARIESHGPIRSIAMSQNGTLMAVASEGNVISLSSLSVRPKTR
jgi:WD40 repeat protein